MGRSSLLACARGARAGRGIGSGDWGLGVAPDADAAALEHEAIAGRFVSEARWAFTVGIAQPLRKRPGLIGCAAVSGVGSSQNEIQQQPFTEPI